MRASLQQYSWKVIMFLLRFLLALHPIFPLPKESNFISATLGLANDSKYWSCNIHRNRYSLAGTESLWLAQETALRCDVEHRPGLCIVFLGKTLYHNQAPIQTGDDWTVREPRKYIFEEGEGEGLAVMGKDSLHDK